MEVGDGVLAWVSEWLNLSDIRKRRSITWQKYMDGLVRFCGLI
jgi:hypothetical protein